MVPLKVGFTVNLIVKILFRDRNFDSGNNRKQQIGQMVIMKCIDKSSPWKPMCKELCPLEIVKV